MKKTALLLVAFGAAFSVSHLEAEHHAGKSADSNHRTLLVGTSSGVYRLDGKLSDPAAWSSKLVFEHAGGSVRGLAFDPATGLIAAGITGRDSGGLFVSRDGGRNWAPAAKWPSERQAWAIGFADDRVLVGSEPADLWEADTIDGEWRPNESIRAIPESSKWRFIHPPYDAHMVTIRRNPKHPAQWLAAIERGGVLHSEDDGRTWKLISPYWDAHVVDFLSTDGFGVAAGEGIHVTTNGGSDWRGADKPRGYATGLIVDAAGTLFAAVMGPDEGPVWRTTDSGKSWQPVEGASKLPHPHYGVHALAADPQSANTLYHGADGEIWLIAAGRAHRITSDLPRVLRVLPVPAPAE